MHVIALPNKLSLYDIYKYLVQESQDKRSGAILGRVALRGVKPRIQESW